MNTDKAFLKAPFRKNRIGAFSFMRLIFHILLLSIVGFVAAFSSPQQTPADTLLAVSEGRHYVLPEFIVSANRWKANVAQLPSSVSVLSGADLINGSRGSLADALGGVAGLYVKSYGGPGSVSTTSIRGMGAEHTLVLVDGMRYNNVRDGQVDFGIMPVQGIERIEILRGGFSSLYGADAIGGIINIVTRRPGNTPQARGEISLGSFGMQSGQLGAEFQIGRHGFLLSARREAGEGNYEFNFRDGISSGVLQRKNADYAINQFQLFADLNVRPDIAVRWSNTYNWSDRGSPGAVLSASSMTQARLRDAGFQSQAAIDWHVKPSLAVRISALFNAQRRTYRDPGAGGSIDNQESDYADRTVLLTPHIRALLSSWTTLYAGGEYSHSTITSDQLDRSSRSQAGLFLSTDHSFEFRREVLFQINVYPSVRYDQFTGIAGTLNPRVGVNLGLWRPFDVRVKASVGRSFRAPSFIDLYWKNSGNPALRPERSFGSDAGVTASLPVGDGLDLEASSFSVQTVDRIVWTPERNGLWSPKNVDQVESAGFELTGALRLLNNGFIVRASYTNSDTKKTKSGLTEDQTVGKQLPYLPHEMAALSMTVQLSPFALSLRHELTGFRYATEANEPGFVLAPFQKTDISISARIADKPFGASLWMGVSNLFNSDYQVFPNFPMPLRSINFRMALDY